MSDPTSLPTSYPTSFPTLTPTALPTSLPTPAPTRRYLEKNIIEDQEVMESNIDPDYISLRSQVMWFLGGKLKYIKIYIYFMYIKIIKAMIMTSISPSSHNHKISCI